MRVALPIAIALALASCKPKAAPCTTMSVSELVMRAALIRLEVYGAGARCDGNTVAAGAPAPSQTQVVTAGQPLRLDVPAGHHVLLVTAFADAAATQLLGSACTEADLKADHAACFNLTLSEPPDASMPGTIPDGGGADLSFVCSHTPDDCPAGSWCAPDGRCAPGCRTNADCAATPATPFCVTNDHRCVTCLSGSDCAPGKRCSPSGSCVDGCDPSMGSNCPSTLMCCSQLCLDTSQDILNCGGCGRACLATANKGVSAASCSGSLCKPTCLSGFADCTEPAAPAPDDGCETNIHDPNHCGNCTNVCTLNNVKMATCPTGTCAIGQCANGFSDCDGQPMNGCECADVGDANHGCCPVNGSNPGGCEYTHSDGYGHNFIDCFTLGTYKDQVAIDAATAFNAQGSIIMLTCTIPAYEAVYCNQTAGVCACFTYQDQSGNPQPYVGRARRTLATDMGPAKCFCPLGDTGDVTWK
jgi:hypothetical protein